MEPRNREYWQRSSLTFVAVSFGVIIGVTVFWKLLSYQTPPTNTSLENILPKGMVAGVSSEESSSLAGAKPQSSLEPTTTSTPVISQQVPSSSPKASSNPVSTPAFITPILTPTVVSYIGFQNGDFSENLLHWTTRGEVQVLKLSAFGQDKPLEGIENFVRLSSDSNLDWLGAHVLEQTFIAPQGHVALEFWYRIHTLETELGFDSPCLAVLVNQQAMAWFSAADASETWSRFAVPLPETNQPITISFRAGQTGDQQKATWVDVTDMYTLDELPSYGVDTPLAVDSRLKLSFNTDATIGLSLALETLETVTPQFTQRFNSALLVPELGLQQTLQNLPWQPDGASFQPSLVSPDFYALNAGFYMATAENPWNLPEQLNQLKEQSSAVSIKLWMVLKTAFDEVLQLLPVEY